MIDSNIVISGLIFPNGHIATLLRSIVFSHSLCIASFSLEEIERVVRRKFPKELAIFDTFLNELPYEIIRTPDSFPELPSIRDVDDRPILATAFFAEVDVLLTGDKDFSPIEIERPKIMTPAQFRDIYM